MKYFFIILISTTLTFLSACNNNNNNNNNDATTETKDTIITSDEHTPSDTIVANEIAPIWIYDQEKSVAVKNKEVHADSLTSEKLIALINNTAGKDKVYLDFVKISHDTIFVRIQDSRYLTQQMGTSGAEGYMTTTTFTLTELKNIKYVSYDFEEGDHAAPGTYSRQHYIDKNKMNNEKE